MKTEYSQGKVALSAADADDDQDAEQALGQSSISLRLLVWWRISVVVVDEVPGRVRRRR